MKEEDIDLTKLLAGAALSPTVEDNLGEDFCEAHLLVNARCELGEGVIFDDRTGTVLWTDLLGKKYHELRLNYDDPCHAKLCTFETPHMLCSFGMLEQSATSTRPLLCAWDGGFQIYDIQQQKALSEFSAGEKVNPHGLPTRLNDGRVAPGGAHFICGGYYGDLAGQRMKVFSVSQNEEKKLEHCAIVESIEVANSICFSPDGETMYLADSPTKAINTYDFKDGKISNKRSFHSKDDSEKGVPDGSCVDSDGFLWNAIWRAGHGPGMVQRVDPKTGQVVFTVHMPDATSQVTCCCFGGKDMNILFITTAAESRDEASEPNAGGLYAAVLPFKGRKEARLDFTT